MWWPALFGILLGIVISIPAFPQGSTFRPGTTRVITGASIYQDVATARDFDGYIAWNSPTVGTRTQTLPRCQSSASGRAITVIDEKYSAATNPIGVRDANGNAITNPGTVNGIPAFTLNSNGAAATFVCDGRNNWMVISKIPGFSVREVPSTAANDVIQATDSGGLVVYNRTSATSVWLPSTMSSSPNAFAGGHFMVHIQNRSTGTVTLMTLNPSQFNTTQTIDENGNAAITIPGNSHADIFADLHNNYSVER